MAVGVRIEVCPSIASTAFSVTLAASARLSASWRPSLSRIGGRPYSSTSRSQQSEKNCGWCVLQFADAGAVFRAARVVGDDAAGDTLGVAGAKVAHLEHAEVGDRVQLDPAAVLVGGGPLRLGLLLVPVQQEFRHGLI
ncbi:hypothetical protein [Streptomyces sp. R41]|uniref:Uncharacterized protein n=1 Tax=Streptomyces sp. R41 TaxID=3238632 RepID=A0AB39RK61_9ACTN